MTGCSATTARTDHPSSTWSCSHRRTSARLAHKGRSFIARGTLGFIRKREGRPFETGTRILKGLELASPHAWRLAERDRFGAGGTKYRPGNVLCTVLIGNTGYRGIRSIVNEDGSDGTVRVSTANYELRAHQGGVPGEPGEQVGHDVTYELEPSSGSTTFGVMDRHTHASITLALGDGDAPGTGLRSTRDRTLLAHIVAGLSVTDDGFDRWCDKLAAANARLLPATVTRGGRKHGFQNTVVRVQDQYSVVSRG